MMRLSALFRIADHSLSLTSTLSASLQSFLFYAHRLLLQSSQPLTPLETADVFRTAATQEREVKNEGDIDKVLLAGTASTAQHLAGRSTQNSKSGYGALVDFPRDELSVTLKGFAALQEDSPLSLTTAGMLSVVPPPRWLMMPSLLPPPTASSAVLREQWEAAVIAAETTEKKGYAWLAERIQRQQIRLALRYGLMSAESRVCDGGNPEFGRETGKGCTADEYMGENVGKLRTVEKSISHSAVMRLFQHWRQLRSAPNSGTSEFSVGCDELLEAHARVWFPLFEVFLTVPTPILELSEILHWPSCYLSARFACSEGASEALAYFTSEPRLLMVERNLRHRRASFKAKLSQESACNAGRRASGKASESDLNEGDTRSVGLPSLRLARFVALPLDDYFSTAEANRVVSLEAEPSTHAAPILWSNAGGNAWRTARKERWRQRREELSHVAIFSANLQHRVLPTIFALRQRQRPTGKAEGPSSRGEIEDIVVPIEDVAHALLWTFEYGTSTGTRMMKQYLERFPSRVQIVEGESVGVKIRDAQ